MARNSTENFPSWALWIMGLLTVLAAALLVLSIVLGVRAGQRQLEIQRRQDAAIALADAIDLHAGGDYAAALDAYKHVLQLEPDNSAAREGIQNVLTMMRGVQPAPPVAAATSAAVAISGTVAPAVATTAPADTPATVSAPTAAPATATSGSQEVTSSADALLQAATTAFGAGRWQEAISRLVALKQADAAYQPDRVNGMLVDAYVNLAAEKDNEDNLEEALAYFDKALELRPNDASLRTERDLIVKYLNVITYFGADWPRAIGLLKELYQQEPDYRDVADRLQEALVSYGDSLVAKADPCTALEQYSAAIELTNSPSLVTKRDAAQTSCTEGGAVAAGTAVATRVATGTPEVDASETPTTAPVAAAPATGGTARGRILYSARDISTGRYFIAGETLGSDAPPVLLQDDAIQPALRSDGQRLLFRNVRNDMGGLGTVDPASGLSLRFTRYAEDSLPSWSPQGNRYVFASNREGDRLWRVYVGWADADGEVTNLSFGESPAWHPASDLIAFRGCDATGNACGIWQMNSSGGDRAPLTTVQADNRPAWSPNGRYVVFMSDGRDGNPEIYRLDIGSGQVLRLTDSPAIDGLPTVSPDGRWVGFVSNRDGAWKIWYVPIDGGAAAPLVTINGDLGNWIEQGIQWVD